MKKIIILLALLTITSYAYTTTINIPTDYSTIQAGIDAASDYDTVLVDTGTYVENVNFSGKNITVASLFLSTQDTSYISQTIIDGNANGHVVTFNSGESSAAILSGFTIQNGNANSNSGGGIYCRYSDPSLQDVTISGNSANIYGGGIYCYESSPILQNVTITNNSADFGGGIRCFDSSPSLQNVTITNNSAYAGGGIACYSSSPSLVNVTISNNTDAYDGGGIYCQSNSSPSLVDVEITGNSADDGGGINCFDNSSPILQNVTITNNSADNDGGGIYCTVSSNPVLVNGIVSDNNGNYGIYVNSGNPSIEYSDFYNNENGNYYGCTPGEGCIEQDPLFVDPDNGNYHLTSDSPCIDTGDPNSPPDPDGTRADMGAFYYDHLSADYDAEPTTGYTPLIVNFYDMSSSLDSIVSWQWDFQNDGTIDSYEQNPSYTYSDTGSYTVSLTVTDENDSTDTELKENYINVYDGNAVDGYVYLDGEDNNSGVKILFERVAPSSYIDSTFSDSTGYYIIGLPNGIYDITFSENGYYSRTFEAIPVYSNTTIQDVTIYTYIPIPLYYSTIQEGINNCQEYDTVLVDTGTYVENINFNGKNITVASLFLTTQDTSYISQTVIDGDDNDHVVEFSNEEDSTAVLIGFTLQNGYSSDGGGIYCLESDPSLQNVTITNNSAYDDGGGIYCYKSSPILENSMISGNSANDEGGGIDCYLYSSPSLVNVTITNNSATDDGGGIYCRYSDTSLNNVTISNNSADDGCGGIYCYESSPSLVNTIVSDNTGNYGIYVDSGDPSIEYSDFYNNENGNFYNCNQFIGVNVTTNANGDSCDAYSNIQENPLFVDSANGDFHLTENSPCIDAGDPTFPLDPDGTIADIGRYYYDQGQNSVNDEPEQITQKSFVSYPNPITNLTNDINISFALKKPSKINIRLYNIKGQLVTEILNDNKPSGTHTISSKISNLSSGIYFIKMDVDGKNRAVKKMVKIE